ncbi:sugar phosphate nucleotidyltransferase [Candidatus Nitronereus thalassa]|uniref:Sugar phosphate nucleotidyltransferase n=1 Tax=Candidatus Nitronereus thalassa TaxID=3020898 RepID=A0ABU3KCN2_9BACT|nr:sugar phosphate nucleotidyltransferase [Candidatus Nitronereus thalassa]MDT7043989.1 sugar phosphate nucleotidyltransferase [Candidatus Nitronereus thalassa]
MATAVSRNGQVWSIILAGGEGKRLTPMVQQWLGQALPKQYCAFVGTRTMFQHTLDRAQQVSFPDHTVTVIARSHGEYALPQFGHRASGTVLIQPENRDTAAGIFLPLTYIRTRSPHAIVSIYPSDHFIFPEAPFVEAVQHATWTAQRFPERLVLLGIAPDQTELQYGWIQPGHELGHVEGHLIRAVETFVEKPNYAEALAAQHSGALWNTFVVTCRASTLWELGWRCVPELMPLFDKLSRAIGTSQEGHVLDLIYQHMPKRNFSFDLLQKIPERIAVIEVKDVLWSDWGHPERVLSTLRQIGKSPRFPAHLVEA